MKKTKRTKTEKAYDYGIKIMPSSNPKWNNLQDRIKLVKQMTDLELRDNIAFHMGWRKRGISSGAHPDKCVYVWDYNQYLGNDNPDDYAKDLNAMYKAEMSLTEAQLSWYYSALLYKEIYPEIGFTCTISAPARIRAEAFILIKGFYE